MTEQEDPLKSLDDVPAELTVHKDGLRLLFPFHSPRVLKMDRTILYAELTLRNGRFDYKSFYLLVYKKTVVIVLHEPERGHEKAKFDREEFMCLLRDISPL